MKLSELVYSYAGKTRKVEIGIVTTGDGKKFRLTTDGANWNSCTDEYEFPYKLDCGMLHGIIEAACAFDMDTSSHGLFFECWEDVTVEGWEPEKDALYLPHQYAICEALLKSIETDFDAYYKKIAEAFFGGEAEPVQEQKSDPIQDAIASLMGAINAQTSPGIDETKIMEIVDTAVNAAVEDKLHDIIPAPIIVQYPDGAYKKKRGEVRHGKFGLVMDCILQGPVFLYGEAGTGKSFICEQIANALDWQYRCTGSISDEFAGLKGFIDANGAEHGTAFVEALKIAESGEHVLMVFDEFDNSSDEVALALNNYLSGGTIEAMGHSYKMCEFMHIVACGNTDGRGGNERYNRATIDQSLLNRFLFFINIDYDKAIEIASAYGDKEIATFSRKLREAARKCGVDMLVTYRNIKALASFDFKKHGIMTALECCMFRGLEKQDIRNVAEHIRMDGNVWVDTLKAA